MSLRSGSGIIRQGPVGRKPEAPKHVLTTWSQPYVAAFFESPLAGTPLNALFPAPDLRDAFIEDVRLRFPQVRLVPFEGDVGVEVDDADPENLLAIVKAAESFGGRVLIPGALPG